MSHDWAQHLGMGGKVTTGEQMVEFAKNGDWEAIKEHCEVDVVMTCALYERIKNCGLIKNV